MNETMKSRNTAIAILCALLIAAVISGAILYREHLRTKDALQTIEGKLLSMNEEIIPSKNALIDDLKNRLGASQSKISNLEAGNAVIESNLHQLQNKYDVIFSQLEELKKTKEQMSQLDQMISAKNQSISGLDERINELERDLEEEQNAHNADLEELKNAKEKISELESLISAKNQSISGLDEKINKLERALEEGQNAYNADLEELKNTKEKISELQSMVSGRDQRISQLQEKLKNLESEFEKEKKAHESVRSELSTKDSMVSSLQEEISRNQSDMLHLREEMTKDKREMERLRLELANLEGKEETAYDEMGRLKSTYEKLVSGLNTQLKNYEVAIEKYKEKISITFVDRILFDSGKASINAQGRRILKKVGETLREVPDRQIRIIGHTDDIPIMEEYRYKFPTNWELSAARAAAVVRYFQDEIGLDPEHLEAVGRSFYQPIASNETEQGRAQNRRVNIIIGPKIR